MSYEDERLDNMLIWIEEHLQELEYDYLNEYMAPENQPLDDDIPDFLDENSDDFFLYCKQEWEKTEEL
jgi:hypothetical protein